MASGNTIIKEPFVIESIFPKQDLLELQKYTMLLWSTQSTYDRSFGRHQWANTEQLKGFHDKLTDVARDYFESDTLLPSWSLLSIYEGTEAKLWKHKDDNACTYHIDLCVFQKTPWDIWVEHDGKTKPYTLKENDGLFMYGNDQEHWREEFPDPENNLVANAFFFFVEPDHWFFTKGAGYLDVIRGQVTEEEYAKRNNLS